MRRYRRRSLVGSFTYGLVIAASGVGVALAAHHMLAPPGPESEPSASASEGTNSTLDRWARLFGMHKTGAEAPQAPAESAGMELAKPSVRAPAATEDRVAAVEATRALVRNIQTELRRVGCYAGGAHGGWDMSTQLALSAFTDIVKVQIKVADPEFVHLTLLQGHGTRACARPCTVEDGIRGCVPRPTVAKARPASEGRPVAASEPAAQHAPAAIPNLAAVPPPPAPAASPASVPPPPVLVREGSWRPATSPMPPAGTQQPPLPQLASTPQAAPPLPGRSALGGPAQAPDPAGPESRAQPDLPSTALGSAPSVGGNLAPGARPARPPVRLEAREPPRRGGGFAASSEGRSRTRDVFTKLNRDSP